MSLLQSLLRPPQERAFWSKAAVTVVSIALALLVRWALDSHLGPKTPFTMLALATLISALFGGWKQGAFVMVVGGSLAHYTFVYPAGEVFDGGSVVACLVFFTQGVTVCVLSEVLHTVVARSALALRKASQDFQSMAEHAEVLIWFTNQDHHVSFVNRYWLTFTGRTREDAQSNLLAPVHPDDRGRVHATRQEGVQNQRPFQMEYRLLRADGEYRWVLEHAIPRFSPQGNFEGYLGSA
ncbi:MAG TPA: PAS domain-containing protein, partial [Opitutaceae bacterium]|nr:PAS domain-containing protein [Opitutaceae bacterium]